MVTQRRRTTRYAPDPSPGRAASPMFGRSLPIVAGLVYRICRRASVKHNGRVHIELLVIPDCPGAEKASTLLRTALDDIGLAETGFSVGLIDSNEAAKGRRFAGSPAFVVDGTDLFNAEGSPGSMACRVYLTPDGPRNVPTFPDLRQALKRRAATD